MKSPVLDLYPTQLALGMHEVDAKIKAFEAMGHHELQDYLEKHPVPVVLGPKKRHFLVDHHHLVRACWEARVEEVHLSQLDDLSKLHEDEFWEKLAKKNWCHLYDPFGGGPHSYMNLPNSVRGLGDDPFRSLAWLVREAGGYEKSDEPFAEFQWANYFRAHLSTHPVVDDFEEARREALRICRSPAAKTLPGYIGK
jgi:hypothetical protein